MATLPGAPGSCMTDPTLEDHVVAFIKERGGGVSFVELEREFPGEFEGHEHALNLTDCDNVVLWQPVSPAMAGAINSASTNGRIVMKATQPIVYAIDGKMLTLPLASKARHYKAPRWLPVTFSPAQPKTTKKVGARARGLRS